MSELQVPACHAREPSLLRQLPLRRVDPPADRPVCSDVREITDEDRKDMAAFTPFDEAEHLGRAGATEPYGEAGFTTLERT